MDVTIKYFLKHSQIYSFLPLNNIRYAVSTQWERQQSEGRSMHDFHSYFCCWAKRIGNMFALISRSDGTPIVIAGPCWPFCLFITLPFIIGISMLVIFFLILGDTFVLVCEKTSIISTSIYLIEALLCIYW